MGYSIVSKGYRVWNPEEKKIVASRNIKLLNNNDNGEHFEDFSITLNFVTILMKPKWETT